MKTQSINKWNKTSGFTLIELLIAITITIIILTAAYAIFTSQHKSYVRRSNIKKIQETVKATLELIRTDIMMAGYGASDKKLAFYFEDGGSTGPDKIYVNDWRFISESELLMGVYGDTQITGVSGNNVTVAALDLDSCTGCYNNCYTGNCNEFQGGISQYVISNDELAPLNKVAKIKSISGFTLALDQTLEGSRVAPAIYYCVDTGDTACHPSGSTETLVLRRSDRSSGGRQPLASNIVDLQVAYRDTDGNWYCDGSGACPMSPFDPGKIDLVRVSIVARTDKKFFGWNIFNRPAVENRTAGTQDGYFYRKYTIYINTRNITF